MALHDVCSDCRHKKGVDCFHPQVMTIDEVSGREDPVWCRSARMWNGRCSLGELFEEKPEPEPRWLSRVIKVLTS